MTFAADAPLLAISSRAFVVSSPQDGQPGWAFFLCAAAPAGATDFTTLWNAASGIVLFTNQPIFAVDGDTVADRLQQILATPTASQVVWRVVAWTDDPYHPSDLDGLHASLTAPGLFTLRRPWTGQCGGFGLTLGQELTVKLAATDDRPALCIDVAPHDVSLLQVLIEGRPLPVGYSKDGFRMPIRLAGAGAGSLRIAVGIDPSVLICAFRCGFLYTAGTQPIFFPMVPAVLRTTKNMRAFDVWLNPIRPLDASCTRFSVDDSGRLANPGFAAAPNPLDAPYFSTPQGAPLTLRPTDPGLSEPDGIGGGFAFSVDATGLYLSPCGLYTAQPGTAPQEMMAGVFGNEFLCLTPGDCILFVANCPSAFPGFAQAGTTATALLTNATTTSWLTVQPGATGTPGYFGQPSASSFFGMPGGAAFLPALDVQLAAFAATSAPFPLVPYGGVYLPVPADNETSYPPPYAGAPDTLLQFEATVLANTRHAALAQSPRGPVFLPEGAAVPDPRLDRAATPQGLLVEVSPDGTASGLVLATSPAYPPIVPNPSWLRFDKNADGVLPPVLGNILTRDQLFLVMSDLPPGIDPAGFENLLDLAGFHLQFDIGDAGGAVLVFKFNTQQTLTALAAQPAAWADAATFSADPAGTSARLTALIQSAAGAANAEAFATFQAIANDPGWTGVLAFDVQVDGNGMPPDLQMLLGGIDGDLRAHHLGVQTNRMQPGPSGGPSLQMADSSLFGVIRYDAATTASPASFPDYEIEHLLIAFSNSRITQSEVTVGITFDTLFGRPVWLRAATQPAAAGAVPAPPNTLQIPGTSQTIDGIDTVTFTTTTPIFFDFQNPAATSPAVRVLDSVEITRASLVPFSSTQASSTSPTQVVIRLLLEGQLWFNAAPFPVPVAIDLFSYGVKGVGGLPFSGLNVQIAFALDAAHGSIVPGSKTAALDESLMQATPDASRLRPASLLDSLPAQFSAYVSAPAGLSASTTGAAPVHILDLESASGATPPYTTAAPLRALEYDIHLGSLGSMSDNQAGIAAKLLLGWGPSATTPDADAAGLLVQLPHLGGGVAGFSLEGLLTTRFGDANLLRAEVPTDPPGTTTETVYALLFNNVQLSFMGYAYPPGLLVDFLVFAGAPAGTQRNSNNIAWFLGAQQPASAS
jgi:hypothetical protein